MCTKIERLSLYGNQLEGSIPDQLGECVAMEDLRLCHVAKLSVPWISDIHGDFRPRAERARWEGCARSAPAEMRLRARSARDFLS